MKYLPQLDALRCFAVFIVIFHHLPIITGNNYLFYYFRNITGVDIFFVLSGFLITTILLKLNSDKNHTRKNLLNFYVRRFLRIFPIYYLSILFLIVANPSDYLSYSIYDILYISNYVMGLEGSFSSITPHFWSLSVEEQFYLFWPVIVFYYNQKTKSVWRTMVLLFLVFQTAWIILYFSDQAFFGRVTLGAYSYLMLGGMLAYLQIYRTNIYSKISSLWFWGFIISLIMPLQYYTNIRIDPFINQFIYLLVSASFVVKFASGFKKQLLINIFESRPIVFLGKISYGLYLYHFIVIHGIVIINKLLNSNIPVSNEQGSAVKIIVTILIASASWYIIEKPLLKLKNRFKYV